MIKNLFNGYFANIDNLNKFDIENCNVDTNLLSEAEKHLLKFIPEIAKQDISEIYKNKFGLSMDELYSMLYE